MTTDPEPLTPVETAELLKVPVRTLEDWRLTRSGPPWRRVGRHVRYERGEVLAWFLGLGEHGQSDRKGRDRA